MRGPHNFFKIVGPLHEQYGSHYRYTVAVIREDSIALFTRVRMTKRSAASRSRNSEIIQGGVRVASWKEFNALLLEMCARMGLDTAPLGMVDIMHLKGNLFLNRRR